MFKATMGGIKWDIRGKAKKKPPVEAWHIAELLSCGAPSHLSEPS